MAAWDAGPADAHLPHLDIHIEDVKEAHSSSATESEAETNGHKIRFPTENQFVQILPASKGNWTSNEQRRCVNVRKLL